MTLFDIKTLFDTKSHLKEMTQTLPDLIDQQHLALKAINSFQDTVHIKEIDWNTLKCFYTLKNQQQSVDSKQIQQSFVRMLLTHFYGKKATRLQLIAQ